MLRAICLGMCLLALSALLQPTQLQPALAQTQSATDPVNPNINMQAHLQLANEAAAHRESHRLTEQEFIAASRESGVVILDARSKERYDELHIEGAMHLSFPDITVDSLAKHFPDKQTKILIYCNNNFKNAEQPFPTKRVAVALNLNTFVTLYGYGYKNVYELGPLLDAKTTKLKFAGTKASEYQTASKE